VAGAVVAAACASDEEDPFTVPYRNAPPPASNDASLGSGGAFGAQTGGTQSTAGAPTLPPEQGPPVGGGMPTTCDPMFCQASFGTPCCMPAGTCGVDFGLGCIQPPPDAGPGTTPTPPPPPPPVNCQKDADCSNGEVCCGVRDGGAYTVFECRASCDMDDTRVACSSPTDCADTEVCCGTTTGTPPVYTTIQCAAMCGAQGEFVQCDTNADCSDGGGSCAPSQLLPEQFTVCR
jgi:hypothetical protein